MRPGKQGYTLIEAMVVVIIIGILAGLAAPQISEAVKNNRVSSATNESVMAFRKGRTLSAKQGLAYRMVVDTTDPGLIRMDRGGSSQCDSLPNCAGTTTPGACGLVEIDFSLGMFSHYDVKVVEVQVGGVVQGGGETSLCITPLGRMYEVDADGDTTRIGAPGVEIRIARKKGADLLGVPRRILIPSGGMPRLTL